MTLINRLLFLFLATFILSSCVNRDGMVKQLRGQWRFSVGDDKNWAKSDYDDSEWDKIYVPSNWENEGYYGYNGFAWYRKSVRISKKFDESNLYLYLGRVDDADEVYFNGVRIGSTGVFPPGYTSAYNTNRKYHIPKNLIKYNADNLIAVRVYDDRDAGGIRGDEIGIYNYNLSPVDYDLSGNWKFHTGDSMDWREEGYNDSTWKELQVPGYWEDQGYSDYDGFAWYRRSFDVPSDMIGKRLVIVLGKIDDVDQVYINGQFVGNSGTFYADPDSIDTQGFYDEVRGYYLPENLSLKEKGNVIAVRIFDVGGEGGIYAGQIGLITHENYVKYWGNRKKENRW